MVFGNGEDLESTNSGVWAEVLDRFPLVVLIFHQERRSVSCNTCNPELGGVLVGSRERHDWPGKTTRTREVLPLLSLRIICSHVSGVTANRKLTADNKRFGSLPRHGVHSSVESAAWSVPLIGGRGVNADCRARQSTGTIEGSCDINIASAFSRVDLVNNDALAIKSWWLRRKNRVLEVVRDQSIEVASISGASNDTSSEEDILFDLHGEDDRVITKRWNAGDCIGVGRVEEDQVVQGLAVSGSGTEVSTENGNIETISFVELSSNDSRNSDITCRGTL